MIKLIEQARDQGDSLGGIIECVVRNAPAGLGEPVFDKLEADLARAMLSLPATKGFEIGSGFAATKMRGSEHNDPFETRGGKIRTSTNYSGGIQGGISNGEEIYFRVAFKPTATIGREQKTVTAAGKKAKLAARGTPRSLRPAPSGANCRSDDCAGTVRSRIAAACPQPCRHKMNPPLEQAAGSMLWQTVFVSFGIILILFEVIRGWRFGLMRQLTRVCAVAAAYAAAIFGGRLLLPIARPFLRMPDTVIAILAGAVLALLIYSVISSLGVILFKRTGQHSSMPVRFFNGISGAADRFIFWRFPSLAGRCGRSFPWRYCRRPGARASGDRTPDKSPAAVHAVLSSEPEPVTKKEEAEPVMTLLARLKNSIELGSVGEVVKQADITPKKTYEILGKVGNLLGNPEIAERFLSLPRRARIERKSEDRRAAKRSRNFRTHQSRSSLRSSPKRKDSRCCERSGVDRGNKEIRSRARARLRPLPEVTTNQHE